MERFLKSKLENGWFSDVSEQRSRIMSAIRGKSNKSTELPLKMALVRAGVKGWVLHPATICGKPDFYFPKENLAVFVDGCFWHGCPEHSVRPKTNSSFWNLKLGKNIERDRRTTASLEANGWTVVRIWEHEVREDVSKAVERILRAAVGKHGNGRFKGSRIHQQRSQ